MSDGDGVIHQKARKETEESKKKVHTSSPSEAGQVCVLLPFTY